MSNTQLQQGTSEERHPEEQTESQVERAASAQVRDQPVSEGEPELPLDQVFSLLKNERRRLVLEYLKTTENPASTSDLAEFVASHETGKPVSHINSSERKRAYVGLYQCHLPKMDDMGVIEFNKPRGIVTLGRNADVADPYLSVSAGKSAATSDAWPTRFLALSLVSLALLVAGTLAGALVTYAAFVGVVAAFGAASLGYWYEAAGRDLGDDDTDVDA
jgi:hypothetical protein